MDCKGEECEKYWSCKYLQWRFGIKNKKCGYDEIKVMQVHDLELRQREEILRGNKDVRGYKK